MTDYSALTVQTDDRGVSYVTLNRPDKRNALSSVMIAELTDVAQTIGASRRTRAIVLNGAGAVFCAGGDLGWMQAQIEANREGRMREARKLAMMLKALNEMATPLIGQIHGGAFGGGVGLACVCDVVVTGVATRFGLTETKFGLIPATIGPYVLARMGEGNARRVLMSARLFSASEARDLGLVARVVPEGDLADAAEAEVLPYLSVAPGAVGAAKALARALGPGIDEGVIEDSIQRLADTWEGEEAAHGIEAFLGKRPPRWS